MTLLAGVYSRRAGDVVPDSLCSAVSEALSRHKDERVEHFRDERCFLAKADVGAFDEKAFRIDPGGGVSLMAGESLLDHGQPRRRSRSVDLDELHDGFLRDDSGPLMRSRGVFSAAHYRPESQTLILATDKLGVRPLYYWLGQRYVIFGSAIRILEAISAIPKVMDVRGVTEENSLGYAVGERTPFASIALLKAAEVLQVQGESSTSRQYWRWDDVPISTRPIEELVKEAYEQFVEAVALRSGNDTTAVAFLSGGLDSRAIVTALRDRGTHVHSFNFSVTGLQDQVFGAAFAQRIGTTHTERPMRPTQSISASVMASALNESQIVDARPADRPKLVWSGDGGSVTLGHVYLNRAMVDAARAGDAQKALDLSVHGWGSEVPRRLLQPQVVEALSVSPRQSLIEELETFRGDDPGRRLHLVLMHNDQRRHMAAHFEDIDLSRLEYHLPFFDGAFVESVLRVPIDFCLGHRFYMQWLRHFPEAALSVPWQAYPGHEPCPLPVPSDVAYQWGGPVSGLVRDAEHRDLLKRAGEMLRASDFPKPLLRRSYLRLVSWLHRFRLRDVGYVIRAAHRYHEYWSKSGGKYSLPSQGRGRPSRTTLVDAATGPEIL